MLVYAAQTAWLQVTPDKHKEARFEVFGWNMPDLAADETLHQVWEGLGRSGPERRPISWQELDAYVRQSGEPMSNEDARVLREMSEAYCVELGNTSAFAKAPIDKVVD